ncbi:MAG: acetyl-CoA C-acetyltransferase, partial [Porticoccaceae bacterium]|nr:acetyl-CoA C-acetyltransferase [Porticoccaceae bacterium]
MSNPIAILSAMRTPMGGLMGSLSSLSASDLGGVAISSAISKSGLNVSDIDEVLMGSVLTAGQGQAPARQAALAAGLPVS